MCSIVEKVSNSNPYKWPKELCSNLSVGDGITVHMMVGNHDAYYKNTNDVNAVELLLEEYDNIIVHMGDTQRWAKRVVFELDGLKVLYVTLDQRGE